MQKTFNRLDSVHETLRGEIRALPAQLLYQRPSQDEWSIAEVIQHLCLVEERVTSELSKKVLGPPETVGLLKRLIPMRIISMRVRRFEAPKALRPTNPPPLEELMNQYDQARSKLKEFCTAHGAGRLRQIALKHPVLGMIDGKAAVLMVAYHELRHLKQIRGIARRLNS